jgi:hypothetical protein
MSRTTWLRALTLGVALTGLVAVSAACGGDDDGDAATVAATVEAVAAGDRPLARAADRSPVRMRTGFAPVPFPATDGRIHLNYELYMTNRTGEPLTITRVRVIDADDPANVVDDLNGARLANAMTGDLTPADETTTLAPNQSGIVYIDASVATMDDVPGTLAHAVESRGPGGRALPDIEGAFVDPQTDIEVPVLAQPVSDGRWVAAEGCCAKSHHRRAPLTLNGQDFLAQRYAIDFIKLGPGDRLYEGDDPKNLDAWYTFGQDALAVSDGTVSSVLNDEDDITPLEPNPKPRTVDNITGNHVIVDMGDGLFVVYAHLQRGSVQVEVGDRVSVGDKLGLVGNSGNTDAPHLHIHVMDANQVVQSEGIPFVFDRFDLVGRYASIVDLVPELDGGVGPGEMLDHDQAGEKTDLYPLELDVLEFARQ